MTFADPHWLWLLALVPVVGAGMWWRARRRTGLRFSHVGLARALPASWAQRLRWLPNGLRLGVLALGIVALARPQVHNVVRERTAEGIDIMLTLDISTSMRAEDFEPNRFVAAKEVARTFIQNRTTDRVGLVVFAAEAYTQAPLTLDYDFLQRMLADVRMGLIDDGTAIGSGIAMAANRLKTSDAESKVIILLTDGQNNRGEIDPRTAAAVADALGIRIYTIGMGTHGSAPFVVDRPFAGTRRRMMPVNIDEEMMRAVAQKTGGRYFRATDTEALRAIYQEIDQLETSAIDTRTYTDRDERYPLWLWPALGLLCVEVLLASTRLRRFP